MDLKQLNYFVTIVDEGNISNAAKKLHMSQPPLSTQMKLLEAELGTYLFNRGSRSISLTQSGKILYERANTILDMSNMTLKELQDIENGSEGTIRIGIISSASIVILNSIIKNFNSKYPKINFEIFEANTYQLIELLNSDVIELAIVRTPFLSENFDCIYLKEESMLAVGHGSYFENIKGDSISMKQLANKPLIVYRRWEKIINNIFSEENLSPSIFCKNDDARTTALWADFGLGVGLVPSSASYIIKNPLTKTKIISCSDLNTKISIIKRNDKHVSKVVEIFLKCIE